MAVNPNASLLGDPDRAARAESMRTELDAIAAQTRQREAAALRTVLAYTAERMHREFDGHSGIGEWLRECFDFTYTAASQMARIARLAPKFRILAEAACSGAARIDAIAYAMLALDRKGLRIHVRLPYSGGPRPSPFDAAVSCATPEATIREYCVHAAHAELRDAIDQIAAALFDEAAMKDQASQAALAHLEVTERPDGMWDLYGTLTADTGRLLENYLKTAVAPPRQDQADADGVLPSQANRAAEAFHQLVAAAGTDPHAPKRHGHTATLSLIADVQVLTGATDLSDHPQRAPRLEGRPVSLSRARQLACEAAIVPMVFDYDKGEVVELGREERLPTTALRRKLEAEQPGGCAWPGCGRPVSWTEAHHIVHWLDQGPTNTANLILLCRFHHSRIHTGKWQIAKTGPGRALITRTGCTAASPCHRCPGCDEAGRTTTPLVDTDDLTAAFDVDIEREEWSPRYRTELEALTQWATDKAVAEALASIERTRRAQAGTCETDPGTERTEPARPLATITGERWSEQDPIPFLRCPQRATAEGSAGRSRRSPIPNGTGPLTMFHNALVKEIPPKHRRQPRAARSCSGRPRPSIGAERPRPSATRRPMGTLGPTASPSKRSSDALTEYRT
jgi:hypothetical protein